MLNPAESETTPAVREMSESDTRTGRGGSDSLASGAGVSDCVCITCPYAPINPRIGMV